MHTAIGPGNKKYIRDCLLLFHEKIVEWTFIISRRNSEWLIFMRCNNDSNEIRLIHQQISLPSGNKIINNGIKNDDFEQTSGHVCKVSFKTT